MDPSHFFFIIIFFFFFLSSKKRQNRRLSLGRKRSDWRTSLLYCPEYRIVPKQPSLPVLDPASLLHHVEAAVSLLVGLWRDKEKERKKKKKKKGKELESKVRLISRQRIEKMKRLNGGSYQER